MGELEDRISSVLSDPEQFGKIAAMAKSIMGQGSAEPEKPSEPDIQIPPGLGNILSSGMNERSESLKMLEAMKPCLSEKRRKKMEKALTLARLARFAGLAVSGMEDNDV